MVPQFSAVRFLPAGVGGWGGLVMTVTLMIPEVKSYAKIRETPFPPVQVGEVTRVTMTVAAWYEDYRTGE